ncbi:hypothetical protein TNCV_480941 [Trichonephila clavipes]|nr:hypothetical protein TNCV_480941 [Trichonephila clavipes]
MNYEEARSWKVIAECRSLPIGDLQIMRKVSDIRCENWLGKTGRNPFVNLKALCRRSMIAKPMPQVLIAASEVILSIHKSCTYG